MATESRDEAASLWDWAPYLAPMLAYILMPQLSALLPEGRREAWYPALYTTTAAVTAILMIVPGRGAWPDLRRTPAVGGWILAVVLGLLVTAVWVGLDGRYPPLPLLGGEREGYDPNGLGGAGFWGFVVVRMIGLAVLVPIFEELFWRSFLMRVVIDPDDFRRVPIGKVTPTAAAITSLAFMLVHPEWLPALLTGLAWAGLLHLTRSVSACVVSHAVANLTLGIYVLATGSFHLW